MIVYLCDLPLTTLPLGGSRGINLHLRANVPYAQELVTVSGSKSTQKAKLPEGP